MTLIECKCCAATLMPEGKGEGERERSGVGGGGGGGGGEPYHIYE